MAALVEKVLWVQTGEQVPQAELDPQVNQENKELMVHLVNKELRDPLA